MPQFDKNVEKRLIGIVLDNEVTTAETNQSEEWGDYEAYLDLFDAERPDKEYDWMSDISLPEFATHMLTQSSIDVEQYFQTRDFVEVYVQDESDEAISASEAEQELQNRTLNRRDLFHYQKYVRAKNINHLNGHVDFKCWWEQEIDYDYDEETGEETEIIKKDGFNYQVLDPRNVLTSAEYAYSLRDKEWTIIRDEVLMWQLGDEAEQKGYFGLEGLELAMSGDETLKTETHIKTVESDKGTTQSHAKNLTGVRLDRYERYGKYWVMEDGSPGIDEYGEVIDGAMFDEMIMTFVKAGWHKETHRIPFST